MQEKHEKYKHRVQQAKPDSCYTGESTLTKLHNCLTGRAYPGCSKMSSELIYRPTYILYQGILLSRETTMVGAAEFINWGSKSKNK